MFQDTFLIVVLKKIQRAKDLIRETKMIQELVDILNNSDSQILIQFAQYLSKECAYNPSIILKIVNGLLSHPQSYSVLGTRILKLWLLFQIYDTLGITEIKQEKKRDLICKAFSEFTFTGSSLPNLLSILLKAAGHKIQNMNQVIEDVASKRTAQIKALFQQEVLQINPEDIQISVKSSSELNKDLVADYKQFPQKCFEKILQKEVILAYNSTKSEDSENVLQILPDFKNFKSQIYRIKEAYLNINGSIDLVIEQKFQRVLKSSKEQLYGLLCQLKIALMSINVFQLQRLIYKTKAAEKCVSKKDVILFIGNTGSGKSTIILKLLGYTLKKAKYKELTTLVTAQKLQKQHMTLVTSPEAKSCTRYMNAVLVPESKYLKKKFQNESSLVLADSPGFGDSAGPEVDIANGIGMINALHQARSVRVVIVVSDELRGERLSGVIRICETISNLFYQLDPVLKSIKVLFNKIQSQQLIRETPKLLYSKLQNLNQGQRGNQKLKTVLRYICEQSKDQMNFVDPLKSNFQPILHSILKLEPIRQVKNFEYSFSQNTKSAIKKFIDEQKKKGEKFLHTNIEETQFRLTILSKFKGVLQMNDSIKESYVLLAKSIQEKSSLQFTQYENQMKKIIYHKISPDSLSKLQERGLKIQKMHELFQKFEDVKVVTKEKFLQLQYNLEKKLIQLSLSRKNQQIPQQSINAVNNFAAVFNKESVKKIFIENLNKQFQEVLSSLQSEFKQKKFDQMTPNIKKSKNLQSSLKELQKKNNKTSEMSKLGKRIQKIKEGFRQEIEFAISEIRFLTSNNRKIQHKLVQFIKGKIKIANKIIAFNYLDKNDSFRLRLQTQIKGIQSLCKKVMYELQTPTLSLQSQNQNNSFKIDDYKIKFKQIQLLITIQNFEEILGDDWKLCQENIAKKHQENSIALQMYIKTLRQIKNSDEIYKRIDLFYNAVATFKQFHNIMADEKKNNELFEKLQSQFNKFLQGELLSLKSINIKISQLFPETITRIIQMNRKIGAYDKMSFLGPLIEQRVKELRQCLNEQIKLPFKQYLLSLVNFMKQDNNEIYRNSKQSKLMQKLRIQEDLKEKQFVKKTKKEASYKYLPYTIQKLQKLSQFFFKLQETEEFHHLKSQREIEQVCKELQAICSSITREVEIFIRSQLDYKNQPSYLIQLVKNLLSISSKNSACKFMSQMVSFEANQSLQYIKNKLMKIQEKMNEQVQNTSNKSSEMQYILQACTFYAKIQKSYQVKGQNQRFGFERLRTQCSYKFLGYVKDDQQKVKMLLKSRPSCINFQQIQKFYKKFCALKNQQGKKELIVFGFKMMEENLLKQLKALNNQLETLDQINKGKVNELVQSFMDAFTLERQLNALYTKEEEKKEIKIKRQIIQELGGQILKYYEKSIDCIMQLLMKQSNLSKVPQQLKLFGPLQNTLFQIYNINHWIKINQKSKIQRPSEQVSFFLRIINQKGNQIKKQIISNQHIDEQEKKKAKQFYRIRLLLSSLKKGRELQLKLKYHEFSTDYSIDSNFSNYYKNTSEEHKKQLEYNVQQYFNCIYHSYEQQFNRSKDAAENIKAKIVEANSNLPVQLKHKFRQKFERKLKALQNQSLNCIQQLGEKLKQNAKNIDRFFEQSKKTLINNNKELHSKLIKQLNQTLLSLSEKNQTIEQRVQFLTNYLLNSLIQHSKYLKEDHKMLEALSISFIQQLNSLKQGVKESFSCVAEFFTHPAKNKIEKCKDQAENILTIYNFYIRVANSDLLVRTKEHYDSFLAICQQKVNQCINAYNINIVNKRPQYKLDSKEQFDPRKINNLKGYTESLHQTAQIIVIIGQIKKQLEKHLNPKRQPLYKIYQITQFQPIILEFQSQLQKIQKFVSNFDFYGDLKRNMTSKQIQQDLQKLNNYYRLLQQKEEELVAMFSLHNQRNRKIFDQIKSLFQKRFDNYVQDAINQINRSFEKKESEGAVMVNLLIGQLQVMNKGKEYYFIKKQIIREQLEKVKRVIKEKFKVASSHCKNLLRESQKSFRKICDELKRINAQQQRQMIKIQKQTTQILQKRMQELNKKIQQQIDKQSDQKKKQDLENKLATQRNNIKNDLQQQKDKKIEEVKKKASEQKKQLGRQIEKEAAGFSDSIIIYQKALIDIVYKGDDSKEQFQKIVEEIKKGGPKFIEAVQNNLAKSDDPRSIGKLILSEQQIFAKFKIQAINRLIKGQDIKYVLEHLKKLSISGRENMKNSQLSSIEQCYKTFLLIYERQKNKYVQDPTENTISYLVNPLKTLANKIKQEFYGKNNLIRDRQKKIHLLAGIFALWAIMKSQIDEETSNVIFTIEPHPTQITTLFLLLGICQPDERIANRLAQVGTGEGKSIVLAGLCSYLALVGFKIRCACYSLYLSGRDSQSFRELFERLGVQNDIKYGTFNQLCEDILNSGGKNLKKQVQGMIVTQGVLNSIFEAFGQNFISLKKNKSKQVRTILVIDEVDVFFEDSFFGKTYCPAISLKGEEVSKVLHSVWNLVQTKGIALKPSQIIQGEPFKNLLNKYPTLSAILQNQVHGMISGALNYKHDYYIDESKLVYKDGDAISDKINYGYKTVFANIFQFNNSRVSQPNLDNSLQISLMVAQFSYAELPSYFQNILGVTGTLQVLPNFKKRLLKDRYLIDQQYVIPSAFGINKKRIEKYVIVPQASYEQTIVQKIKQIQDNRPIIIFFKGPRQINQFARNPLYQPFNGRSFTLTECHDASTRDSRIIKATNPNNITLMSSVFGRGTDFILLDDKIKQAGGLHVIQAFLSHDQSQEIQIKGRTARQNGKGSYYCILCQEWLEEIDSKLKITTKNASTQKIHQELFNARQIKIENLSQSTKALVEEADKKHKRVFDVFTKSKLSQKDLVDYVGDLNKYPLVTKAVIKTIVCLDATGSMSSALQRTCQIIGAAFERSYAVLAVEKEQATIEVKFKVYRNYNTPFDEIIEGTAFESTPVNLKLFLDRVRPKGGIGNEALQVLFQSLNKEDKVNQVILIGDAAPNTKSEVTTKRAGNYGQNYWIEKGFPKTHIDDQIALFKAKKCPVHSFYLNNGSGFLEISQATNGKAERFQINSPKVTENLTNFIVENILKITGEETGNANLVDRYRKMYC